MKKYFLTLVLVLLCSTVCLAGEGLSLRPDVLTSPVKLTLDGEKTVFRAPGLFGVVMDVNVFRLKISPGLYSAFEVDTNADGDFKLGLAAHVGIWKKFGFGFFYDFWQSGEGNGITGLHEDNTGFLITYNVKL